MVAEPNGTDVPFTIGTVLGYVASPGSGTVNVQGRSAAVPVSFTVLSPPPTIVSLVVTALVGLGSRLQVSTTVSGGLAPITFRYSGLPPGCAPANASNLS